MTRRPFYSETDLLTRSRTTTMLAPKPRLPFFPFLLTGLAVGSIGLYVLYTL